MSGAWKVLFSSGRRAALVSVVLLTLAVALSGVLEASMATHMLVHIPMILFSGMLAYRAWRIGPVYGGAQPHDGGGDGQCRARHAGYDEYGIAGLLWASFIGAYWMLPRSLDQVLVSSIAHYGKFGVLMVTGFALSASLRRANSVIKLFFLGNFCWMSAIVGLLYQESPQRLCNFYLLSDQEWAGKGMVAVAVVLPLFWLYTERHTLATYFAK